MIGLAENPPDSDDESGLLSHHGLNRMWMFRFYYLLFQSEHIDYLLFPFGQAVKLK